MTGILSCEGQKAQRAKGEVTKVRMEVAARGACPLAVLARLDGRHGDGGTRKREACRRTWGRARARGEAEQGTAGCFRGSRRAVCVRPAAEISLAGQARKGELGSSYQRFDTEQQGPVMGSNSDPVTSDGLRARKRGGRPVGG